MTGNNAIVDSNVFIDLMKGSKDIANRLEALDDVYISPIVLAELRFGALCSGNPARHLALVKQATDKCKLLLIDAITAEIFVETKLDLKTKGKPIPENDIWIAASAIQHKLKVFTNDQHFYQIEKLTFV